MNVPWPGGAGWQQVDANGATAFQKFPLAGFTLGSDAPLPTLPSLWLRELLCTRTGCDELCVKYVRARKFRKGIVKREE